MMKRFASAPLFTARRPLTTIEKRVHRQTSTGIVLGLLEQGRIVGGGGEGLLRSLLNGLDGVGAAETLLLLGIGGGGRRLRRRRG